MVVIRITGIPGSGKTHFRKLVSVPTFDTDDYLKKAFTLLKKKGSVNDLDVATLAEKLLDEDLQHCESAHKLVVGLPLKAKVDTTYFIKMDEEELRESYTRFVLRELHKFKKVSSDEVFKKISKVDIALISQILFYEYGVDVLPLGSTGLEEYSLIYEDELDRSEKEGWIPLTKSEILKNIEKVFSR